MTYKQYQNTVVVSNRFFNILYQKINGEWHVGGVPNWAVPLTEGILWGRNVLTLEMVKKS